MRIDSHHHIWDLSARDQSWITGDAMQPIRRNFSMSDLREAIAGHGIDKTVLVQTVTDYAETPELLALAESDPLIAGVVGWLKIDAPDAIEHLRGYLDLPGANYLKSIRDIAQDHPDSNYLGKAETITNVRKLSEFGIAYDLLTKTPELPAAVTLVKACPDVQFIMDHISKPYIATGEVGPWKSLMTELASLPNVVCKVSGLVTEAKWHEWKTQDFKVYVDHLIEIFTPQRLMFGSDWPVATLGGSYSQVINLAEELTSGFSVGENEDFWSGTAIRAYRLNP
ncbi:COG3618 Predicted metal-dependent hydrolase of the TIM-barrel fold [actinobacterium SCGC AAA044-D11]